MAERMSHGFSVFNLHCNKAGKRADKEFIAQYGKEKFEKYIKPYHDGGIMEIFEKSPFSYAGIWISLCTAFVNENRA